MNNSALRSIQNNGKNTILIVDKIGVIGEALSREFSKDYLVFLVSKRPLSQKNKNIVLIPFKGRIPKVPENLYFKTFIVDDGENITRESVLSFIKKAKETNTPLYFMGSIRNIDLKQADEIIKKYTKVKVLIFGDIFDNEILFDRNTSITKFIIEARKNKKIKVPGAGLALNYPISFLDTIKLIIKASYIETPGKAILLFSKYPITDISLANMFQKVDPEIDVDFENEKKTRNIYIPKNSQYALEKYDLKKKLEEVNLGSGEEKNDSELKSSYKFRFLNPVLFFIIACIFLMLLPLVSTFGYSKIAEHELRSAVENAEKGEMEKALNKSKNAKRFYNFAEQTGDVLLYQANIFNKDDDVSEILKNIETGKDLSKASTHLIEGALSLNKMRNDDVLESRKELDISISSFKNGSLILQELNASGDLPKDLENKYLSIVPLTDTISEISEALPQVLGFDREKKYLILFTNNYEIRSGGGVVELLGILSVKNGNIANFELINTREIDEKQTSIVEPPFPIKRHLKETSFTIRDSLISPDFPVGAAVSASIYELVKGESVDGVIGVSNSFFEKLVSKNVFLDSKTNNNFNLENLNKLPLQDNDSYHKLIKNFLSKRENAKPSYFSIAEIIGNAILDKDLLFVFKNEDIQNTFSAKNLSGELKDVRTDTEGISDYFGISESNIGDNKANYYISRSVLRSVETTEDGQITSSVKISFKNNSEEKNALEYKSYIRLILPRGSRIQSVSDGGKSMNIIPAITDPAVYGRSGFVPPLELEIEETNEGDKSVFSFFVSVSADSSKNVTIKYLLPFRLGGERTKYSLIVYKQPGIKEYAFDQIINLPENYKILPSNRISSEINRDREFIFQIFEN